MMLKRKYGISRIELKLIALVAMVLDHIVVILLKNKFGIDFYHINVTVIDKNQEICQYA